MNKTALITGITGQDGAYLTTLLIEKGYTVHGIIRRTSLINNIDRLRDLFKKYDGTQLHLHYGDLSDGSSLLKIISNTQPDEIYHLAAMSHVKVSFEIPEYSGDIDALGTLRILEAVRALNMTSKVRIYNAATSELYGKVIEVPQTEKTPFYPRSPYGVAKQYGFWICKNYRESYNMFISNGILFNHTSPLRGETFICRKTTRAVAAIAKGLQDKLIVGNLDAKRDFGHAKDYVYAMWKMLQHDKPNDFVIASGEYISIREFITKCFEAIGVKISFKGTGIKEKGIIEDSKDISFIRKSVVVEVDKKYFRPAEVDQLLGDATKARKQLKWKPVYNIDSIIKEMILSDLKALE